MFIKDWMTKDPVTVAPDSLVIDAQELMRVNKIRRLPVVEKGKLVGIITLNNIREAAPSPATSLSIHEMHYLLSKLKVKEIMTHNPITVSPDTTIEASAVLAQQKGVGAFPVVEKDGKLAGIITATDIFYIFIDMLGLNREGSRINIEDVGLEPGPVAEISQIVKENNLIIQSLFSLHPKTDGGRRSVVVRVNTAHPDKLVTDLKAAGFKVTHVS